MTHTATQSVPEQGKFHRALASVWTFLQSLESTSFDYTLDRIDRLVWGLGRLADHDHVAEARGRGRGRRGRHRATRQQCADKQCIGDSHVNS